MTVPTTPKPGPLPEGPQNFGFLRLLPGLLSDPLPCLARVTQKYEQVIQFRVGGQRLFLLNHPAEIHHVLKANHANYSRRELLQVLLPLLGNGLFTSDDAYWIHQRRRTLPLRRDKGVYCAPSRRTGRMLAPARCEIVPGPS